MELRENITIRTRYHNVYGSGGSTACAWQPIRGLLEFVMVTWLKHLKFLTSYLIKTPFRFKLGKRQLAQKKRPQNPAGVREGSLSVLNSVRTNSPLIKVLPTRSGMTSNPLISPNLRTQSRYLVRMRLLLLPPRPWRYRICRILTWTWQTTLWLTVLLPVDLGTGRCPISKSMVCCFCDPFKKLL